MATNNLNLTIPPVGTLGPLYAQNVNDALQEIDDAAPASVVALGAVGNGVTNDLAVLQSIINAHPGATLLFPPGKSFRGENNTRLLFTNVTVIADGATFKNMHVQLGNDVVWRGGKIDQDNGTGANSLLQITGDRVTVRDVTIVGTSGWTGVEIRDSSGGVRPEEISLFNVRAKTKSGFTLFGCRDVNLTACHAESTVSDDLFVCKDSLGNGCEDVTLANCTARNGNALLAIGSEVSNGGYVRNVKLVGARGTGCAKVLHIKPGGVDGVSGYTNGLVEAVTAENCQLVDIDGTKLQTPIDIAPGRGATVRGIRCRNITVRGRQFTTASARSFIRLNPILGQDGINGASVTDVQFDACDYIDYHSGLANGTTTPGYPLVDGITLGGSASVGVVKHVFFRDVTIDGAEGAYAAHDGAIIEGELVFDGAVIRNIRKTVLSRNAFHLLAGNPRIVNPSYDASVTPASLLSGSGGLPYLQASGTGSPEGVVFASIGSTWLRTDGGAGTTFYVKESGTGTTGWVGK